MLSCADEFHSNHGGIHLEVLKLMCLFDEQEQNHQQEDEKLVCSYWKIFASIGGCFRQKFQKRMAETEVQKCLDWLLDQNTILEQCPFGSNKQSVLDGASTHVNNNVKLVEFRKHVDKLRVNYTLKEDELQAIYGTYLNVQALNEKRSGCLETVKGIASLEDQIQGLSTDIDNKAVQLVHLEANNRHQTLNGLSNESMAKTTRNCISACRQSWAWLDEIMQCAHVHLANAAAYHEFFHEVEEVDYWMNITLSTMHISFREKSQGDRTEAVDMNREMKDTLMAYLRWQSKVDSLAKRARDIVPVNKRTTTIREAIPVLALTSYKTNEIEFHEGDTLTLLDNTDKTKWQIKNARNQVAFVPAVTLLISGPFGEAVDAALRLRLQLLGLWTSSVKRLGHQMIAFIQLVFKQLSADQIKTILNMPQQNREELLRVLKTIDNTLQTNWKDFEGFDELQKRISGLVTILEEARDKPGINTKDSAELVVVQVQMLEELLNGYQEFWTYWETYKIVVQLLRQPKYIVVCDKWDQLKYQTTAHYIRFLDTNLQMPQDGKSYKAEAAITLHETSKSKPSDDDVIKKTLAEDVMTQQKIDKPDVTFSDAFDKLKIDDELDGESTTEVTEIRRRQQMTTDEVRQSTEEVRHTFIIKTVWDPRTQKEVSLTEAVMAGLIDQVKNQYINIVTGKRVSFQEAMAQGDITVEFKSQKKIREEKSSYGILTIKTIKETRPYTVLSVVDPATNMNIAPDVAYKKAILSASDNTYQMGNGEKVSIIDAIHSGLVKAEFHGNETDGVEEETKTYAVHGVMDKRLRKQKSFHEALHSGILDGEEGVYINSLTGERIPMSEAIDSGLIKARIITDSSPLDNDPTNKIVVQRLVTAKEKIVNAVKVARSAKSSTNGN